jgi:hypothetical protein
MKKMFNKSQAILQETSCIQNALLITSKSTILERIRRKESSKADHAVAIFGHKRHLPDILETHILNSMPAVQIVLFSQVYLYMIQDNLCVEKLFLCIYRCVFSLRRIPREDFN